MEWSEYEEHIRETMDCFTYEPEEKERECRGAGGRKFRRVCIYCPNYTRWLKRAKKETEEKTMKKEEQADA